MKTRVATFPLRLPVSLKTALQVLAERDGTSLNQFLVVAAAEKLAAMHSEDFLEYTVGDPMRAHFCNC